MFSLTNECVCNFFYFVDSNKQTNKQSNTTNALQIALDAVYEGAPSYHYQSDYGREKCYHVIIKTLKAFRIIVCIDKIYSFA